jgi:hypothetical protein
MVDVMFLKGFTILLYVWNAIYDLGKHEGYLIVNVLFVQDGLIPKAADQESARRCRRDIYSRDTR